jgi:hypothetical protein
MSRELPMAGLDVTRRILSVRGEWIDDALCRRREHRGLGWTDDVGGQTQATQLAVCARCPVREPCRDEALKDPRPKGVRAGIVFRNYGNSLRRWLAYCEVCHVQIVATGASRKPRSCSYECRAELLRRSLIARNRRVS